MSEKQEALVEIMKEVVRLCEEYPAITFEEALEYITEKMSNCWPELAEQAYV